MACDECEHWARYRPQTITGECALRDTPPTAPRSFAITCEHNWCDEYRPKQTIGVKC